MTLRQLFEQSIAEADTLDARLAQRKRDRQARERLATKAYANAETKRLRECRIRVERVL